ncbi:MAG TPA: GIY-YIG nuclease family protein [Dictyobacter sp.]|nr:GIY-YIG nuclease family protein [Dictyobacter sp.]
MYVVYALVDQRDNKTFYVGITDNVYKRFQQDLSCSGTNLEKNVRMLELRTSNSMPLMIELERTESITYARGREKYWIKHYAMLKHPITNIVHTKEVEIFKPKPIRVIAPVNPKGQKVYRFNDIEKLVLVDLYREHHNIDACLQAMQKGARYQKDASRLLKEAGLL